MKASAIKDYTTSNVKKLYDCSFIRLPAIYYALYWIYF